MSCSPLKDNAHLRDISIHICSSEYGVFSKEYAYAEIEPKGEIEVTRADGIGVWGSFEFSTTLRELRTDDDDEVHVEERECTRSSLLDAIDNYECEESEDDREFQIEASFSIRKKLVAHVGSDD